ncbi:MAG: hypothetical protein ACI9KE_001102 [Polyangiales bacterium]|jgi:hypothetical protein
MSSADTQTLEDDLAQAREALLHAGDALRSHYKNTERQAYSDARANVKRLERELGHAKGEEVAIPYPWSPIWNGGAPEPHIVASGHRVYLLYYVHTPDPDWDGTYVNVIDSSSPAAMPLAIVEVERCYSHRFGGPNGEVFHGHPLGERGLDGYGVYVVEGSKWIAEHRATNSVHSMYDESAWEKPKHFFFAFHDNVFECIAQGFNVETVQMTFADALTMLAGRVVS